MEYDQFCARSAEQAAEARRISRAPYAYELGAALVSILHTAEEDSGQCSVPQSCFD